MEVDTARLLAVASTLLVFYGSGFGIIRHHMNRDLNEWPMPPQDISMFPMDRKVLHAPVTIEYTSRGKRVQKTLNTSYEARSFYARMQRQGRKPRVTHKQAG